MANRKKISNNRRELVSSQIHERAAEMFAERGFEGTSLQDVADALDVSRTSLYHYVGGKQELLTSLIEGLSGETAKSLEALLGDDSLDPVARLRLAIEDMVTRIANRPARFRLLLLSEPTLGPSQAKEHLDGRRRSLHALSEIISIGIEAGDLSSIDPRIAAFAILGMCNWVAWWYRREPTESAGADSDPQSIERIASTMAGIGLAGLGWSEQREVPTGGEPLEHALDLLRGDVDRMGQLLALRRDPPTPAGS
jgi:AcrR family transcriptional regulator